MKLTTRARNAKAGKRVMIHIRTAGNCMAKRGGTSLHAEMSRSSDAGPQTGQHLDLKISPDCIPFDSVNP
jgi:hypothetical protein